MIKQIVVQDLSEDYKTFILRMLNRRQMTLVLTEFKKDSNLFKHQVNVYNVITKFLEHVELSKYKKDQIRLGAIIHDVGNIIVNDNMTRNDITDEEKETIKQHVLLGKLFAEGLGLSRIAVNCIHYHHERFNGKGYIFELKGEEIPYEARVVRLIDSFVSKIEGRPGDSLDTMDDVKYKYQIRHKDRYDPELVDIFLNDFNVQEILDMN